MSELRRERPRQTPDGYEFPYSHFGDTQKRTALLQDIGQTLGLDPKVVVNVGVGYDITPSDAFPNARVIHVDTDESTVEFLTDSGFEAFTPDNVPSDLEADLAISILCPDQGDRWLSKTGTLVTTNTTLLPVGMVILGLVGYNEDSQEYSVVSEFDEMSELWNGNQDVHLAIVGNE